MVHIRSRSLLNRLCFVLLLKMNTEFMTFKQGSEKVREQQERQALQHAQTAERYEDEVNRLRNKSEQLRNKTQDQNQVIEELLKENPEETERLDDIGVVRLAHIVVERVSFVDRFDVVFQFLSATVLCQCDCCRVGKQQRAYEK